MRREKSASPLRYRLKRAILQLGPTGFPFENLIGQLFERNGFKVEVGIVVQGKCVKHEMDVIATNNNSLHLVECKYHKDQGKHVSIQVPLYVNSRVDDIIRERKKFKEYRDFTFSGWVITNTRFSSDSIEFSKCINLNLLGWDYPYGKGLKDIIEKFKLYPITVLQKITAKEKEFLMEQGIVTCDQLSAQLDSMKLLSFSKSKNRAIRKELSHICN